MLDTLHIRNFALIDDLVLPWKPGLNVLTGETGAGKSIIVDAMSLLLGERAAVTLIRQGATRADIEALFDISHNLRAKEFLDSMEIDSSSDQIVLRRVISAEGKSKCFLNGTVVTLATLSKVGVFLVDMHGQHEHQSLLHPGKHLALLDDFGGLGADVAIMRQSYNNLRSQTSALDQLVTKEASRGERISELEEYLARLDEADLKEGEEAEIRSRKNVIANSEKVNRMASEAYDMLFAGETHQPPLVNAWGGIMHILGEIAKLDITIERSLEGYQDVRFKLDELASMLQSYLSGLEYDPAELEALEKRLATISKLKRKHDCDSFEQLLQLREEMREEYNLLTGSSVERVKLETEVERLREEVGRNAFVLSQKRSETASRLEEKIQRQLRDLGMDRVRFQVAVQQEQSSDGLVQHKQKWWKMWNSGVDKVEFLFSANVGEPLKPLRDIASGGEISRIMLAIRTVIAESDGVPVIIFDEIDSGVGGGMGMTIAEKLASVAASQQVICVTHLPQIAAIAHNHAVVGKTEREGRTYTDVDFPRAQVREQEIARMLGGEATGKITLKHARELLALAQKLR